MSDDQQHSASREKEDTPSLPINERSLSIDGFCIVEDISRSTFNKLRRMNLAPEITEIVGPGLSLQRITPEARREWHQRIKKYRESTEALLAHARRQQQLLAAGQKSAASEHHVSKQGKKTSGVHAPRRWVNEMCTSRLHQRRHHPFLRAALRFHGGNTFLRVHALLGALPDR